MHHNQSHKYSAGAVEILVFAIVYIIYTAYHFGECTRWQD